MGPLTFQNLIISTSHIFKTIVTHFQKRYRIMNKSENKLWYSIFGKRLNFCKQQKPLYFAIEISLNMHSLSKFDHQVVPLKETFLKETFDVKREATGHLLSGLHRGRMCFCLSWVFKKKFLKKLFNDTSLRKLLWLPLKETFLRKLS